MCIKSIAITMMKGSEQKSRRRQSSEVLRVVMVCLLLPHIFVLSFQMPIRRVVVKPSNAVVLTSRVTHRDARKNNRFSDEDYDYDSDEEYYEDDSFDDAPIFDNLSEGANRVDGGFGLPSPFGRRSGWRLPESVSKALLAGTFILGVGLGVAVDSAINTNPRDLASRDAIDQAAPNPTLCATYGASAMAFDQRVFVSFNPFNVYVAQADVKPACVLRPSNVVSVLRDRKLINDDEVRACKNNMNTWAYVGGLDDVPQLSCVYKSAEAQNEFLSNPKWGIGEDYMDDDRAKLEEMRSTSKIVKGAMTEAQKQQQRNEAKEI
jgi:hypothetical protein